MKRNAWHCFLTILLTSSLAECSLDVWGLAVTQREMHCQPLLPPTKSTLSAAPLSSSTCGASTSTGSAGSTVTFVPVCWMNCWRLTCRSSFVSCSSSCSLSCQERENIRWVAASIKQHFKTLFAIGQLMWLLLLMRKPPIFKFKRKSWKVFYSPSSESESTLTIIRGYYWPVYIASWMTSRHFSYHLRKILAQQMQASKGNSEHSKKKKKKKHQLSISLAPNTSSAASVQHYLGGSFSSSVLKMRVIPFSSCFSCFLFRVWIFTDVTLSLCKCAVFCTMRPSPGWFPTPLQAQMIIQGLPQCSNSGMICKTYSSDRFQ